MVNARGGGGAPITLGAAAFTLFDHFRPAPVKENTLRSFQAAVDHVIAFTSQFLFLSCPTRASTLNTPFIFSLKKRENFL